MWQKKCKYGVNILLCGPHRQRVSKADKGDFVKVYVSFVLNCVHLIAFCHVIAYFLTPWSRVFLEKLAGS